MAASYSIQDECLQDASQGDKYVEQTNKGKKAQCRIAKEMIRKSSTAENENSHFVCNKLCGGVEFLLLLIFPLEYHRIPLDVTR